MENDKYKDLKDMLEDLKTVFSDASNKQIKSTSRPYYNEGYKQALDDYAIWKDGVQVIGCLETPIKEIFAKIDVGEEHQEIVRTTRLDDSYARACSGIDEYDETKLNPCPECGEMQTRCPSGLVCKNGHGF